MSCRSRSKLKSCFWVMMAVGLALAGCVKRSEPTRLSVQSPLTPTGAATEVKLPEPTMTLPAATKAEISRAPTELPAKPSPTLDCTDGLNFISDLTVPDGTSIARGVEIDKRWQVKNSGTCNWDEGYSLVLIAGPDLGQGAKQALIPARAGAEAMIRLLLIAPVSPGSYTSAWQAHNPAGEPFGEVIYIQFQVN
jgi:hypothetical protein